MTQKKLQHESTYEQYDMDGDGIVTDEELEHAKEIRETERDLRKSFAVEDGTFHLDWYGRFHGGDVYSLGFYRTYRCVK